MAGKGEKVTGTICLKGPQGAPHKWCLSPFRAGCVLVSLLAGLAGCAGYQIGNQSLYPAHIQTVYVPVFDCASFRRNLGEQLTEAVIKEIELKTPYKVVNTPNADSVLSGRIVTDTKHLTVPSQYGDPRQIEMSMTVLVTWVDRCGKVLRNDAPVPMEDPAVSVLSTARVVPEVGQSVATGNLQAIQRAAEQIVALMEAPW